MVVVIGYQLYDTARTDYGMSIREASFQLGLLGLVQFVPLALLTPVAGWAADRFERRSVAIFSNLIDITIAATLGWFTWAGGLTLPLLFASGVAAKARGAAASGGAPGGEGSALIDIVRLNASSAPGADFIALRLVVGDGANLDFRIPLDAVPALQARLAGALSVAQQRPAA